MAVTAEQLEGSRFLRVRDDRDPDFQDSASVQGNIGTQKSLMAGEYLFHGGRHAIRSLCDRDGAIARASQRGMLVDQNGVWRDRKRVVRGQRVYERVNIGGGRLIKKKKTN